MRRRHLVGSLAGAAAWLIAASAAAKDNNLYVAWDAGLDVCKAEVIDFYTCLFTETDFNMLASQYPTGRNVHLAGTSVITGCASKDFTCVVNKSGFAVADGDIVLHFWGNGCINGYNNWDVFVNGVHIHGADVQTSTSCACQEALSSHEIYEAAADASAADCCNGQTQAPNAASCSQFGAPGYGWYKLTCPTGTYEAQLLGKASAEFDPSGCTKLTVGPPPPPPTAQTTGNDAMTLVNWPSDGHAEIFVQTLAGQMLHTYSNGSGDMWSALDPLDVGATCGAAAAFWPAPKSIAELFDPKAGGGTQHLWWSNKVWNKFQDLGGMGLSHLSTLAWPDGHVEVFALGDDHAIWHDFWDGAKSAWSGWSSMGGSVATGAGAILWGDGHAELFATDAAGAVWHSWSGNFPGGWHAWDSLGGSIASRPVPVRWADGHIEIFARGTDGQLYHSDYTTLWPPLSVLSAGTTLQGEPSAIMNPAGQGASAGPEVFARDDQGKVVHLWWDGKQYTALSPHLDQASASDPFAWIRADGKAEVFAIDPAGALQRSYHNGASGWTAWAAIGGMDLNPCVPKPPPMMDGGPGAGGAGGGAVAGAGGAGGREGGGGAGGSSGSAAPGALKGGCSCRAGDGGGEAWAGWIGAAFAALIAARRRALRA